MRRVGWRGRGGRWGEGEEGGGEWVGRGGGEVFRGR